MFHATFRKSVYLLLTPIAPLTVRPHRGVELRRPGQLLVPGPQILLRVWSPHLVIRTSLTHGAHPDYRRFVTIRKNVSSHPSLSGNSTKIQQQRSMLCEFVEWSYKEQRRGVSSLVTGQYLTVNGLGLPLSAYGGVSVSLFSLKSSSSSLIFPLIRSSSSLIFPLISSSSSLLVPPWPLFPLQRGDLAVFQVKHLSISDLRQIWVVSVNNNFRDNMNEATPYFSVQWKPYSGKQVLCPEKAGRENNFT